MSLQFDSVHRCCKAGVSGLCAWCAHVIQIGELCDYYVFVNPILKYGRTFYMHAKCTEAFKAKLLEDEKLLDDPKRVEDEKYPGNGQGWDEQ